MDKGGRGVVRKLTHDEVERDIEGVQRFLRWLKDHDVGIVLAYEHQKCTQLRDSEVEEFVDMYRDARGNGTDDEAVRTTPAETPEAKRR